MVRGLFIIAVIFGVENTVAQKIGVDTEKIKSVVNEWTLSHDTKNIKILEGLYDDNLIFYCGKLDREKCIALKEKFFNENNDLAQKIVSALTLTGYNSGIIKCEFVKEVTINSVPKKYPSYLLLQYLRGSYRIVGEGDELTDKALNYNLSLGKKLDIFEKPQANVNPTKNIKESDNFYYAYAMGLAVLILSGILVLSYRRKYNQLSKIKETVRTNSAEQENESKKRYSGISTHHKNIFHSQAPSNYKTSRTETIPVLTPEEKGYAFECFIVEHFDKKYFNLKKWTGDNFHKGIYPEENRDPDLHYTFIYEDKTVPFAVECKYRSGLIDGCVTTKPYKVNHYKQYARTENIQVYVVVGLGGEPNNPNEIFLLPVEFYFPKMTYKQLEPFKTKGHRFFYNCTRDRLEMRKYN
jgi:hypothetical protein